MRTPADVFPLILPCNEDATAWEGFLSLPGAGSLRSTLWLRLRQAGSAAPAKGLQGAELQCSPELLDLLEGYEDLVAARLGDSPDVPSFLLELRSLLERLLRFRPPLEPPPSSFYAGLLAEIGALGWQHVAWLCPHMSAMHLRITDAAERQHVVKVQLPASYPRSPPLVSAEDLPEGTLRLGDWRAGASDLAAIARSCEAAIARMQDLWACLQDLDQHAWVLEPERPRLSDTVRRIALGRHASLLLDLDPAAPRAPPPPAGPRALRFMGSEAALAPLQAAARERAPLWDPARMPRENLERLLGASLPGRGSAAPEDVSADCAICFARRLLPDGGAAGETPDVSCPNAQCARPYHARCLREWLLSVSTSRKSFGTIFGECPYCSSPITVVMR